MTAGNWKMPSNPGFSALGGPDVSDAALGASVIQKDQT